jgi:PAS domain-containing protein
MRALPSFIDITARERAEAASRRLAAIVESSDDAIIGKDLNGIVTGWNRGAERILGAPTPGMQSRSNACDEPSYPARMVVVAGVTTSGGPPSPNEARRADMVAR